MFEGLPIVANLGLFTLLAGLVWAAGTRLSYLIDAVAEQTGIARAFLGLILLATATELPEMVTTITAVTQDAPQLALNNMFGGMLLQLAVLGIADAFVKRGTLTSYPRNPTAAIAGLCSIVTLAWLLMLHLFGDQAVLAWVGYGSLVTALLYLLAMRILHRSNLHSMWSAVDLPDEAGQAGRVNRFDTLAMRWLIIASALCALVILLCGALLVNVADRLAAQSGLGVSFIGITLLSFTTSMPELSTAIAAVRVKAYSMAISNVLGSNLIMTFLIFPVDIAYLKGAIINQIDASAAFALAAGIALTAFYSIALLVRSPRKWFGIGADSFLLLLGYVASVYVLYRLR